MGLPDSQRPFNGVDHVAIAVYDIDSALKLYARLGLSLVHRESLPVNGTELAYLDGRNVEVQLAAPLGPGLIRDHLEAHGEGLHHLCLVVDNIPRAVQAMTNGDDPTIFMGGRGRRACFLTEQPHNVLIELTEAQPFTSPDGRLNAPGTLGT